jgi:subtilase family serine protease
VIQSIYRIREKLMVRWSELFSSRALAPDLKRRRRARLRVEQLEDRTLLSVSSFAPPYTPAQIRHAYGFDQLAASNTGAGQTIAIVDAYYDPTIASDVATFSSQFGLPQLDGLNGNGTFTQIDLSNRTLSPSRDDWTIETALDVEWAHAIAPQANIVLVEAASDRAGPDNAPDDMLTAVDVARGAVTSINGNPVTDINGNSVSAAIAGVSVISMSWGVPEGSIETNFDFHMQTPTGHQSITFIASSGDSGAPADWPAVSPYVVAAGGTTLNLNQTTGAWSSETGWGNGRLSWLFGGSGGGISKYEAKPSYQSSVTQSSTRRTTPDISFDSDPNTGYYVYDGANGGWYGYVGGTSEASPQLGAMVALADQLRGSAGTLNGATQTLPAIYAAPSSDFHDIVKGNNGYAAGPGYDLVTGRGSPIANLLVPYLASWTGVSGAASTNSSTSGSSTGSGGTKHHAELGTGPGNTSLPTTATGGTINQQPNTPTIFGTASSVSTVDLTSIQLSLRLASAPSAPAAVLLAPAPGTVVAVAAITPAGTSTPVAPAFNSGGSRGAESNSATLLDDTEDDGNAQPSVPDQVSMPTQHPAPPLGGGVIEMGIEESVPPLPPAIDAVFMEDYAPAAVEMPPIGDTPAPQGAAVVLGLVAALALNGNTRLRQADDHRRLVR